MKAHALRARSSRHRIKGSTHCACGHSMIGNMPGIQTWEAEASKWRTARAIQLDPVSNKNQIETVDHSSTSPQPPAPVCVCVCVCRALLEPTVVYPCIWLFVSIKGRTEQFHERFICLGAVMCSNITRHGDSWMGKLCCWCCLFRKYPGVPLLENSAVGMPACSNCCTRWSVCMSDFRC